MGNGKWVITIEGSGANYNNSEPGDANVIAETAVQELVNAGQRVTGAVFDVVGLHTIDLDISRSVGPPHAVRRFVLPMRRDAQGNPLDAEGKPMKRDVALDAAGNPKIGERASLMPQYDAEGHLLSRNAEGNLVYSDAEGKIVAGTPAAQPGFQGTTQESGGIYPTTKPVA
jgi:hypothetical protein